MMETVHATVVYEARGATAPGQGPPGAPIDCPVAWGGKVVASICVWHYVPVGPPPEEKHAHAVVETGQRISHALGHGAEQR